MRKRWQYFDASLTWHTIASLVRSSIRSFKGHFCLPSFPQCFSLVMSFLLFRRAVFTVFLATRTRATSANTTIMTCSPVLSILWL
jgi:hypothetical protein